MVARFQYYYTAKMLEELEELDYKVGLLRVELHLEGVKLGEEAGGEGQEDTVET